MYIMKTKPVLNAKILHLERDSYFKEKMLLLFGLMLISAVQSLSSECPPHSCLESQTCCTGSDDSEYGCCAIPEAVCCPSGNYCCPQGFYCDESQGICVLNEPDQEQLSEVSAPEEIDLLEAEGTEVPVSGEETVSLASEETNPQPFSKRLGDDASARNSNKAFSFCDEKNYCHELMTCCPTKNGGHGCCPFEDAVCCPDMNHCCPRDQECDANSKGCIDKTDSAKLVKHVNLP